MKTKTNWYIEYQQGLLYDKCRYDLNKAQFICCLHEQGYQDFEIYTCGYVNNLLPHIEIKYDNRIIKNTSLLIWKYPLYMDFVNAITGWDVLLCKEDFDRKYPVGNYWEDEWFYLMFKQWEATLTYMNRYIMQYESIHGEQELWKNKLYK